MFLTGYGKKEWGIATVVALGLAMGLWFWLGFSVGFWWGLLPIGLGWVAVAGFFRDPIRRVRTDLAAGVMLSPADGTISAVEYVDEHEATNGEAAVVVRLFLSVLNVHVNRAPGDCAVVRSIYREGKFLDARSKESAKINESNLIILERENGAGGVEMFGVRQVSGKIARRIVDGTVEGQVLKRGERFGMIKFGSTTELILPRPGEVEVRVKVGDKVRGGLNVLAEIADKAES